MGRAGRKRPGASPSSRFKTNAPEAEGLIGARSWAKGALQKRACVILGIAAEGFLEEEALNQLG